MPLLAQVDPTIVVSAVGSATVLVVGAIGREVYKVKAARWAFEREQRQADEEVEKERAAGERQVRKDTLKEYADINKRLKEDIEESRQAVHDVRNDNQILKSENVVIRERLTACEQDRQDLHDQVDAMAQALEANGIKVFRRPPHRRDGDVVPHGPDAPGSPGAADHQ